MKTGYPSLLLLAALAACGHKNQAADRLDNAAEQSTPAAAAVLHNEADQLRDQGGANAPVDQAGSTVQQAMQKAGNAQAEASQPRPGEPVPPSRQAKPHRAGDPVPPPTTPVR